MQFSAYHSVYPDMPSSLSQSTMFCTGLPGLSSVTEFLDHSDREFIRQIPQHGIRPSSPLGAQLRADLPMMARLRRKPMRVGSSTWLNTFSNRDTRSEIDFLRICARP